MRRALRSIAIEALAWALVAVAVALLAGLVLPRREAVVAGVAAAALLALASWGARARMGWARLRGLRAADRMDGEEFEAWLATLFRARGYRVMRTATTGDFGADLILSRRGRRVTVQAKRRDRPVGVSAVQEAAAARLHYGTDDALVVTNQTFTRAAHALAGSAGVELWGREELARELLGRRPAATAAAAAGPPPPPAPAAAGAAPPEGGG